MTDDYERVDVEIGETSGVILLTQDILPSNGLNLEILIVEGDDIVRLPPSAALNLWLFLDKISNDLIRAFATDNPQLFAGAAPLPKRKRVQHDTAASGEV